MIRHILNILQIWCKNFKLCLTILENDALMSYSVMDKSVKTIDAGDYIQYFRLNNHRKDTKRQNWTTFSAYFISNGV